MSYRCPRPTIKNLRDDLGVEHPKELLALLKAAEPGFGATSAMWGREVEAAMAAADKAMGGVRGGAFGVEAIRGQYDRGYWGDTVALYVNTGDTYNVTLLYDVGKGRFFVTSMGDWAEDFETRTGRLA